jgi:benzodiazapine receptor
LDGRKGDLLMGRTAAGLVLWILASLAAGWIGSQFAPGDWYASLAKPSWTPPDALFGQVWTVLYIVMGIAAWLVWQRAGFSGGSAPLLLFIVQLVLNTLWSYVFFGAHEPMIAFFEIVILWIAILVTITSFWQVKPLAGVLLIPYLCWVGFALALNFEFWRLNI